jgi:hypothetical protein
LESLNKKSIKEKYTIMKVLNTLCILLFLISGSAYAQKYALLDKKMTSAKIAYTNAVTLQHDQQSLFPVEKDKLLEFVKALENIQKQLNDKKIPESFEYSIGNTHFKGTKLPLRNEDRLDIILTTDCGSVSINMHLVDAKSSCATNAYYLGAWIKYIKTALK